MEVIGREVGYYLLLKTTVVQYKIIMAQVKLISVYSETRPSCLMRFETDVFNCKTMLLRNYAIISLLESKYTRDFLDVSEDLGEEMRGLLRVPRLVHHLTLGEHGEP